ncbi:MAG: small multi-drug export protein [Candidatus Omnitrophica bacterium]|nr:small multi-drug export protein [Candidatus Omnitrophota bacterium]MBU1922754.1 small multi-drug export protein [Candidatus Omnitrophota bacterium]
MVNTILSYLKELPKDYIVMIVAALPVSELRGAIPLALSFGMSLSKAFWLSVLGNCIIVAPALFLFKPITDVLRKFKIWSRFFDWVFERTRKNSDVIQRYEALGLAIFVAIPLPITGAWSGVIAASLFKIRFRYAFMAIVAGIIFAGFVVSSLCALGILSWKAVTA